MKNTTPVRLNPECIRCLIPKRLEFCPEGATRKQQVEYMQKVMKLASEATPDISAPVLDRDIARLQREIFGYEKDYEELKAYFNNLMLGKEAEIEAKVHASEDPLKSAIQYAMMGNYIDFGAIQNVNETALAEFINNAPDIEVHEPTYHELKQEILTSHKMVYLVDNCGEVVMDKILIRTIQMMNPELEITVIVRGVPVLNDVTMKEAKQVGLDKLAKVIDNGNNIPGTWLDEISEEASREIEEADFVISKGQGNFETLQQCGKNIYYIFMCKCDMFANRFGVPKFSGMLLNDKKL